MPVQRAFPPDVGVCDGEDRDEDHELDDPEPAERVQLHRERVEEDDLDVEEDEEDRRQVEADREAALATGRALGRRGTRTAASARASARRGASGA